ncbi:hypothetical protein TEQG_02484 [Trichophyton equinum CBS 127.97]|uniref:Uncharacterized protein n=1 Tax=Trichophyton equinum (strain ATCC MYA-4606 / CBS 127.97) TaxID=559882 RepID=F2PNI0_TRIEC|nr:hypothetical protein TEQG_02484 [Trichophyton equinum CBS 127.97]
MIDGAEASNSGLLTLRSNPHSSQERAALDVTCSRYDPTLCPRESAAFDVSIYASLLASDLTKIRFPTSSPSSTLSSYSTLCDGDTECAKVGKNLPLKDPKQIREAFLLKELTTDLSKSLMLDREYNSVYYKLDGRAPGFTDINWEEWW